MNEEEEEEEEEDMETETAIYFFGKDHPQFAFLSNFYPCQFIDPKTKVKYNSSEQYYVHQKFLYFDPDNVELIDRLMQCTDSQKIKKIGRQVGNFDEEQWSNIRIEVMQRTLYHKFSQNKKLAVQLLKTKDKELFEASPHDAIWGIGYGPQDAQSILSSEYGLNLLGRCLMEVRSRIREENPSLQRR